MIPWETGLTLPISRFDVTDEHDTEVFLHDGPVKRPSGITLMPHMRDMLWTRPLLFSAALLALAVGGTPGEARAQQSGNASVGATASGAASLSSLAAELRQALPADVAERIIARVSDAQSHALPGRALGERALKFAAKGVAPSAIERSVTEQAVRMVRARDVLNRARKSPASAAEIEAGAEALRQGVDGKGIHSLAASAPSGRSLTVPLYVLGNLAARGLPSDQALHRVEERLRSHASDDEVESLLTDAVDGHAQAGAQSGAHAGEQDGSTIHGNAGGSGIGIGAGAGTGGIGVGAGGAGGGGIGVGHGGGGPPAGVSVPPGQGPKGPVAHPPHPPHP